MDPVDIGRAMRWIGAGDTALLRELVGIFMADYPRRLEELRSAIRTGDAKGTERAAHGLKGAVVCFGAAAAGDLASQLETMGREAGLDRAPLVLRDLEREMERIAAFFGAPGWEARIPS